MISVSQYVIDETKPTPFKYTWHLFKSVSQLLVHLDSIVDMDEKEPESETEV